MPKQMSAEEAAADAFCRRRLGELHTTPWTARSAPDRDFWMRYYKAEEAKTDAVPTAKKRKGRAQN